MNFFSSHPKAHKPLTDVEDAETKALADRLKAEATRWRGSAPPRLHGRVMQAVASEHSREEPAVSSFRSRTLRLSAATAAAAVLFLMAIQLPFESHEAAPAYETRDTVLRPSLAFADYLDAPERAEARVNAAAAEAFLAEYEKLTQDARSAGQFVWSTTKLWVVAE